MRHRELGTSTVAIVGLGLMGGSLALALKDKCARLVGVARRSEVADFAVANGGVDTATCDMQAAVKEADIIVLATPLRHILSTIPLAGACMRPGALMLDLGSTKAEVVQAMGKIPGGVSAIGGHPMCGKEVGGLESADGSIFKGAVFVLTPTVRSTAHAMCLANQMVEAV